MTTVDVLKSKAVNFAFPHAISWCYWSTDAHPQQNQVMMLFCVFFGECLTLGGFSAPHIIWRARLCSFSNSREIVHAETQHDMSLMTEEITHRC